MGNVHMEATQINYREGDKKMSVAQAIKNAGNTGLAHTADIAPEFSTESAYSAGDFVYHNGSLYEFTANHAAGAWSTADTQAATVGGKITSLEGDVGNLSSVKANQITIAPTFSAETAYDPGDLVYYNGLSYRCVNAHEGAWDADDFAATTISNELASLMSGLTNAAKTVYRDFHRIEPEGSHSFNLTLEENHAYILAICGGNNGSWGYCGIMLKGWVSYAPVLSDIYKGTYITVTVDNTDSLEVSNTETQYQASCEIMLIDLGRGQQSS